MSIEPQAAARRQQRIEELCAATIRALADDRELHFRARRLHRGEIALPVFGPHLDPSLEHDDFDSFRGAADGMALRLLHSDPALHRATCPSDPVERWVFELLEQLRVESLAPDTMPGLRHNLRHRFEQWSLAFHDSGTTETHRGRMLYTIAQMARSRLTGDPVTEATEDLIETARGSLAPHVGAALAGLRRHRAEQAAYAPQALAIARVIAMRLRKAGEQAGENEVARQKPKNNDGRGFRLLLDFDAGVESNILTVTAHDSRTLAESSQGYRVFQRAHDREIEATGLQRPAELAQYRERLDALAAEQPINRPALVRRLRMLLARPNTDGWEDAQETGRIDGRRLALLVASPAERRLFRTERVQPQAHAAVTILIDCSGSMKRFVEPVALLVDVFARALHEAGAHCEVLGFTTGAWNGGRPAKAWARAGHPPHPGRLNETWHLVFKDADTSWRRARRGIAALLKTDVFREGVDGEAVEWACSRLAERDVRRRWLLVVSDGCPMDRSTAMANDEHYLDHHLRTVVARHERAGEVQIAGVGVGLDLSPYYGTSVALDLTQGLTNAHALEIVEMMQRGRKR